MLVTTGHQKVRTDTIKAYRKHSRKPQQYNYHHCQLSHVTPGNALVIAVCILMLPMVQLSAKHVQLAAMYHMNPMNPINQWYVHRHHMNVSHTPVVLLSLGNVLPAIALQNSVIRLNISCPSHTSSHFSVRHTPSTLHLNLLSGLGRRVAVLVLVLLLLLSGDIETNPGPVGQEDLKSLHSELHPVADKWYSLGIQLHVPVATLKCIEAEHKQINRCLLEMLTVWLKCTNPPPTWNILTEALDSPPVGEKLLAQQLRDKYCQRTEESTTHVVQPTLPSASTSNFSGPDSTPTDNTVSLDKQSVKQQVKKLERRFSDLVDRAYKALLGKKAEDNVRYFRSSFLSLDVSRKREHQKFIHEQLMKMDKEATFDEIWEKLADYWNFLNFDLLDYIVDKFDIEDLRQQIEFYEDDLQSFRRSTRLCDFINCWPVQGETPPETELREFVAKMKHDWDSCTLEDLESLKGVITRKFFLPEFALLLKQIKEGCVVITWLIPIPFVKVLQEDIASTSSEFFMEQMIKAISIGGQECYPSPKTKHSGYQQKPSVSVNPPTPDETLKPDASEEETLSGHSTPSFVYSSRSSALSSTSLSAGLTGYVYSSRSSSIGLRSGYPSRSSSYASRGLSSGSSPSYASGGLHSDYSSPSYASSGSSSGYSSGSSSYSSKSSNSSWYRHLFYPTPAERYVRDKCMDVISQYVKLLPSVEQYLSKAEVEADPSLPTKYKDYLSSTPAIKAALYTPFNARMVAEVFSWSQHTKSSPPTNMTELLTAFTLKILVDRLSTYPVYKQQLNVTTISDLPTYVYKQFQDLCRMANEGILNRQQLVFSTAHLPTGFVPLGLMQEVPQLYADSRASYYHFIHFTLQEYLAAVHISQLPAHEQTRLVREHLNSRHFKLTMRFLAGLTKLANMPPDIARLLMESDDTKLTYFHFLFEAKHISVTTRTLGSDLMVVDSHYSWTPLDYYVTGHAISHSDCLWKLDFFGSSIDDDKFELFCKGCAAPGVTGCRGQISYAEFWDNDIPSKCIQSFINIPPHILQNIRVLHLNKNKLDGGACDLLAKAVPSMSRLEDLSLSHHKIGSGGAVEVIKALGDSVVKQLWLYNTGIGMPDCEALSELLKSSHSLQDLHIDKNSLSSESVTNIITGLSHNSSLTRLDISNSHFSMANVDRLASILRDKSKCALAMLWLRDCHISVQGASELAAALRKNSTLKRLSLDHNPIGVEGASSISDMLQHNTSLQALNLHDDSVGEEGVRMLINSLKHNQTLRELWLPLKYMSETSDHRIQWWEWWF